MERLQKVARALEAMGRSDLAREVALASMEAKGGGVRTAKDDDDDAELEEHLRDARNLAEAAINKALDNATVATDFADDKVAIMIEVAFVSALKEGVQKALSKCKLGKPDRLDMGATKEGLKVIAEWG